MPDKKTTTLGNDSNVVSISLGDRVLRRKKRGRLDPPPHKPRGPAGGVTPARKNAPPNWSENELGMPAEDPGLVLPVGHLDGHYFYISSSGEFRDIVKHDHEELVKLYALTPNWPMWALPKYGKPPKKADDDDGPPKPPPIEDFEGTHLRRMLIRACERKGTFDPKVKMRGRGGWKLRNGNMVYHAGEELWVYYGNKTGDGFRLYETGQFDEEASGISDPHLYPRLAELSPPWTQAIAPADNQAGALLAALSTFEWRRPAIDPLLLLGWIGVAYLGGWLDWRSSVLVVGDKGTGKSTIHDAFKDLFGDALFHSSNSSAAGIYQDLAHDSRPCELDELEPGSHRERVQDLIDLMRQSASGSVARRGSAGGTAISYQLHSAFLFSAINNPLYDPADYSRVAVLRLAPLAAGKTKPPAIDADRCGPMILARMMTGIGPQGVTFFAIRDAFMAALAAGGHDARGQKTYGTLLACAEIMLGAELAATLGLRLSEDPDYWRDALAVANLPEAEITGANWRRCAEHIFTKSVEPWRGGGRTTVGQALADLVISDDRLMKGGQVGEGSYSSDQCARDLARTGLGLLHAAAAVAKVAKAEGASTQAAEVLLGFTAAEGYFLAVPNEHPEVAALFRDTPWARNGWTEALRQCPDEAIVLTDKRFNKLWIGGTGKRCTLIALRRFHGEGGG